MPTSSPNAWRVPAAQVHATPWTLGLGKGGPVHRHTWYWPQSSPSLPDKGFVEHTTVRRIFSEEVRMKEFGFWKAVAVIVVATCIYDLADKAINAWKSERRCG